MLVTPVKRKWADAREYLPTLHYVTLRTLSSQLPDANIVGFCTTCFDVGRQRTLLIFFDTKFATTRTSLIFRNLNQQRATYVVRFINESHQWNEMGLQLMRCASSQKSSGQETLENRNLYTGNFFTFNWPMFVPVLDDLVVLGYVTAFTSGRQAIQFCCTSCKSLEFSTRRNSSHH